MGTPAGHLMTGDVARLAHLSKEVVLYHVRHGRLSPAMLPDGRRLYDVADVLRFIADRRANPPRRGRSPKSGGAA